MQVPEGGHRGIVQVDDLIPGKQHIIVLAPWRDLPQNATWFTNIVDRMSRLNNNYTLPLTSSLAAQHGTRYAGLSNDLSEDPTFPP